MGLATFISDPVVPKKQIRGLWCIHTEFHRHILASCAFLLYVAAHSGNIPPGVLGAQLSFLALLVGEAGRCQPAFNKAVFAGLRD